jgi:rhodanese-related sulfurtransferase
MQVSKFFVLIGYFLSSIFLGSVAAKAAEAKGFKTARAEEFDKLRADKANIVLDVRRTVEFTSGHIPGAVQIDWNGPDFEQKVSALDKSKMYLVYCAVGGRSSRACEKMSQLGFAKVYNLEGGIIAWKKAGKPVTE